MPFHLSSVLCPYRSPFTTHQGFQSDVPDDSALEVEVPSASVADVDVGVPGVTASAGTSGVDVGAMASAIEGNIPVPDVDVNVSGGGLEASLPKADLDVDVTGELAVLFCYVSSVFAGAWGLRERVGIVTILNIDVQYSTVVRVLNLC